MMALHWARSPHPLHISTSAVRLAGSGEALALRLAAVEERVRGMVKKVPKVLVVTLF